MVSLTRMALWIAVILGVPLFLVLQGDASLVTRVAGGIVLLALVSILMFSGRSPVPKPPKIVVEPEVKIEPRVEIDLPEPVLEVETASQRKEEKIKRSRGKSSQPEMPVPTPPPMPMPTPLAAEGESPPPAPMPVIAEDDGNVAARYVAESNPQGDFEAEVEEFVGQRRAKRAEIRSRIERKRRMKMAERRAAKAKMWSAVEDGEDLAELLKQPDHGMTVFDEPESPDSTKPQGVSYVRIDEERILRLRVPLEVARKGASLSTKQEEVLTDEDMPPMPPIPGMPPMPPPPGMPPMPPPVNPEDS
tara:strand:+ start:2960 stop:3871 length:912 start_codon:yes stop_codon:yes gene_type:complete